MSDKVLPSVLVVDDSPAHLRIVNQALEGLDCRMLVAKSGQRALQIAKEEKPELVLLDVVMNEMDGFETCRRLKADEATANSVVLFLSGLGDPDSRLKGLQLGGVDYIAKPFSIEEVRAKVGTHLEMLGLRRELEERNQDLQKSNKSQSRMLGMAAHDLRTPLTAIIIAADTLRRRRQMTVEMETELLDIVENSSRTMKGLINELLTVSRLQSNELSIKPKLGNLNRLVETRMVLHELMADNKKISIKAELGELPELDFDPDKMAQVIDNLISNALKYSWPESEILVKTETSNDGVQFSVKDHGVGIDPQHHSKVFLPFSKLGIRPTAQESSHGLGLAIVANIVRAHEGEVWLESAPDQGSTFFVSLPTTRGTN